jgi:SAM-dependent methyltransferase
MTAPDRAALLFDRALLGRHRARAARHLADHDFLLRHVADDLRERLSFVKRSFPLAVDLGAATGVLGDRIAELPSVGTVVHVEANAALAAHPSRPAVRADEEALPFADGSLDLVVSGLALHLVNDLPGTLVQIRRALKPDGLLLAAMLGGRTLHQLRSALVQAEADVTGGASPRVAPFADVRALGALLQRAGFALPVVDADELTVSYAGPLELMAELRAMGGANALVARSRRPLRRDVLGRAIEIYRQIAGEVGGTGRVIASFEVVTLTAWAPHASQPQPLRPGTATHRLADALAPSEPTATLPRPMDSGG